MGSPPHRTHFRPPDEGGHGVAERLRWHQGDALALGQLGEWVALALLVDQSRDGVDHAVAVGDAPHVAGERGQVRDTVGGTRLAAAILCE